MSEAIELVIITLTNWIHLAATVTWIGGISTMILVVGPTLRATVETPMMGKLMIPLMKRMKMVTYISGALLILSGVVIQLLDPVMPGLETAGRWMLVLWIKHGLTVVMILIGIYISETLGPKIGRLAAEGPSPEVGRLQKRQMSLGVVNLLLGLIVLLLSGYMDAIA